MKYFVIGDVHGEYYAMRKGLDRAGFDSTNLNHTLISLGDNFDRGGFSRDVYDYLNHLPRAIFVRGNHELILQDIFNKGRLSYPDIYNGCPSTVASFAHMQKSLACYDAEVIFKVRGYLNLQKWLNNMKWYYETNNYIFVHGWVPFSYYKHRNLSMCTDSEWGTAVWAHTENEISVYKDFYEEEHPFEKVLIIGHWHTWKLWESFNGVSNKKNYDIWYDDKHKIVCLDSCSGFSKKINVLVIED